MIDHLIMKYYNPIMVQLNEPAQVEDKYVMHMAFLLENEGEFTEQSLKEAARVQIRKALDGKCPDFQLMILKVKGYHDLEKSQQTHHVNVMMLDGLAKQVGELDAMRSF